MQSWFLQRYIQCLQHVQSVNAHEQFDILLKKFYNSTDKTVPD